MNSHSFFCPLGQALTGMGCPFISCVPTKVSQNWFGESERTIATLILGMSNPLGLVLGQLITPLVISQPSQLPILNLIWFLPALPGFLLTVFGVKSSLPPSPPSPSAASAKAVKRKPFLGKNTLIWCKVEDTRFAQRISKCRILSKSYVSSVVSFSICFLNIIQKTRNLDFTNLFESICFFCIQFCTFFTDL